MLQQDNVVSMWRWMLYLVLLAIPLVNIITLFVLAFGSQNQTVRNYGRASLILGAIAIVIGFLVAMTGTQM
ncbi:hypothetical protein [Pontibacillus marinus]|uniref:Uncharacterized protein n=1 Tax=Pontibacillus marinus BH030004 = DSM 16465 TaxID=1385511 RepID=A0A0A5G937_9BACI|nr:hypothetical protein [Pontibacillus marinus]KGX89671.1 hypothetical protein N783_04925 [Pontibacillus marinus BH030004 = DSM 16465]